MQQKLGLVLFVTRWGEIKVELISHAEHPKKKARVINSFECSYVPGMVKSNLPVY